jgi:hypothetical protein
LSWFIVNEGVATGGSFADLRPQEMEKTSALTAMTVHATTETGFRMNLVLDWAGSGPDAARRAC